MGSRPRLAGSFCEVIAPLRLPDITRDTSLKILGVTITGNLSASDHGDTSEESSATALRHYTPCASYGVMAYVTPAYALSSGL